MNKKERTNRFKSLSSIGKKALILKKMNSKDNKVGNGIPNKEYESRKVYEFIHIANFFPELREKK